MPPGQFLQLPAHPAIHVVNATDLRVGAPDLYQSGMIALVSAVPANSLYRWDATSLAADDGSNVIKPTAIAGIDPGRFLRWYPAGPPVAPSYAPYEWQLNGVYDGAGTPSLLDAPIYVEEPFTATQVRIFRRYAGTAGQTAIQIRKNGVSIWGLGFIAATPGDGDYFTDLNPAFTPGANVFVPGDRVECYLASVETYKAGPPEGPEGLRVTMLRVPLATTTRVIVRR